jgi:hypothetical protein
MIATMKRVQVAAALALLATDAADASAEAGDTGAE